MSRRRFIETAGTATAAAAVLGGIADVDALLAAAPERPRVGVLWEPGFPSVDSPAPNRALVSGALSGTDTTFLDARAVAAALAGGRVDVLVLPYGSAFPKEIWEPVVAYLRRGGNLVNLGGVPAALPVRREGSGWQPEARQTAYHKRLGITQAFPVAASGVARWEYNTSYPWTAALAGLRPAGVVQELYVRLTSRKEFPEEDGSSGRREAVLTPLLSGVREDGFVQVVPVLQLDRLAGEYAGGRWILATSDAPLDAASIRAMVAAAALGSRQLTVRPSLACYHSGEDPTLSLSLIHVQARADERQELRCGVRLFDPGDRQLAQATVALTGTGPLAEGRYAPAAGPLKPGLYRVEAELEGEAPGVGVRASTGFWLQDAALLASGEPLRADGAILRRGGRPFPVTGTTYMASDVHRAFLLEPNPLVWDRDFGLMKAAGINMVRTGIWTGFERHAGHDGTPREEVLRAAEAFFLTARRHDIPVVFTFFAFLPVAWGGENVYLDPRSVAAQKRFATAFAARVATTPDIVWDLINEPSFSSPAHLWSVRPNYDRFEEAAWAAWLERRFPAGNEAERRARLQELWRTTPEDALRLPSLDDFPDRDIFTAARPLKALEYRLFAQDMFARWTRELATALRQSARVPQMVTVGQDEGGTDERPANQFLAPELELTCIHNWWNNDDLAWDQVVTKAPGRPNLTEETGIMFAERIDGSAWRTEELARDLLERKLVLSLGLGGAGFIEWIWNANPYMPLDNEAAIGLLRDAGSAKPELDAVRGVAAFAARAAPWLEGREPAPALLVVPQSNLFSVRDQATDATRRAVRSMLYTCRTGLDAVGEYNVSSVADPPALVLVPAPRILREDAWRTLLGWAERGSTLVLSGPIDLDEHWLPVPRLQRLGIAAGARPVAQTEVVEIAGQRFGLSFRGNRPIRVETATSGVGSAAVVEKSVGRGRIVWSPVPVELAQEAGPTVALYRRALALAGIGPGVDTDAEDSILAHAARFRDAILYSFVSEAADPATFQVATMGGARRRLQLSGGRAAMLLVHRSDGRTLASYGA